MLPVLQAQQGTLRGQTLEWRQAKEHLQVAVTEVLCLSSKVHFCGSSSCLFSFGCKSHVGGMFRCKSHVSVERFCFFRMCLEKIFLLEASQLLRLSSSSSHRFLSAALLSLLLYLAVRHEAHYCNSKKTICLPLQTVVLVNVWISSPSSGLFFCIWFASLRSLPPRKEPYAFLARAH